ncbi:Hsp20/alpha crystallin family protein [Rubrimonas cliftonensis]|uniref:Uncharacterized protein n=1 Tax=Rubrimonas cliftonensis TaxID=89524 RepID=A0A1H4AME0_9RHOB|nr:Hsp20/alpha crystallin family protein [Rubrimonas cliftonensis]SEA37070.1 hypothetical protein SAMN05444370_104291 [Rubrimonas cliftonensis]
MASRDDKELRGREAIEEIDRRLGGLLGPLAEGLARIVDAAEKAQDADDGRREATVETSRGPVKMRSGFSVKVGGLAGGGRDPARPVATPAAAAQPAETPLAEPRVAEPHHDVFETETSWSLAAELPGAAEADLTLTLSNGRLTVETTGARRWRLSVDAPAWLTREALSTRLVNGILDLAAQRGGAA